MADIGIVVDRSDCCEWPTKRGYAELAWTDEDTGQKGKERVHRLVAQMVLGRSLERGECVCHRCDNPRCFNPSHLFIGSHRDNMRDMSLKGRNGLRRLPESEWLKIEEECLAGSSYEDAARKHGVAACTLSARMLRRGHRRGPNWRWRNHRKGEGRDAA